MTTSTLVWLVFWGVPDWCRRAKAKLLYARLFCLSSQPLRYTMQNEAGQTIPHESAIVYEGLSASSR
jgi:hypothetical protein